jgi:mRNA interferase MazF
VPTSVWNAALRGEVRLVDLDPVRGSERRVRRPAVIVSNDAANSMAARLGRGVITVVPVTSSVDRVHPFQVLLAADATGMQRDSKAQAEQVRSVDVERIGPVVGRLRRPLAHALDAALRVHLALSAGDRAGARAGGARRQRAGRQRREISTERPVRRDQRVT